MSEEKGRSLSCDEGSTQHLTSDHFPRSGLLHNPWSAACEKHGPHEPSCWRARCLTCQHVSTPARTQP